MEWIAGIIIGLAVLGFVGMLAMLWAGKDRRRTGDTDSGGSFVAGGTSGSCSDGGDGGDGGSCGE